MYRKQKMRKKVLLSILTTILLSLIVIHSYAFATTYYSATNGSGTSCLIESPCALRTGLGKLTAGDTLYLRGGTYTPSSPLTQYANGTEGSPIVISGYQSENAIIDGEFNVPTTCPASYGVLLKINGDWVTVQNLTVTRSGYYGLYFSGDHITGDNVTVSYSRKSGFMVTGDDCTVQNCTVYENSYCYNGGSKDTTNCACISTWGSALSPTAGADSTMIKDCLIFDNWGEGLSAVNGCTNSTFQDNIIWDNCSVNMYLDSSAYTLVQRNISYFADLTTTSCSKVNFSTRREYAGQPFTNNTIINNLIKGGRRLFNAGLTNNDAGLVDFTFAYNTLINADASNADYTIRIAAASGTHSNTIFKNNIIVQDDSTNILYFGSPHTGITWSYNLWSEPASSINDDAEGTGDIYSADPLLAKTGPTGAGELIADWFRLTEGSPNIDHGIPIPDITEDFFGNPREINPDIGAYEYEENGYILPPTGLRIVRIAGN